LPNLTKEDTAAVSAGELFLIPSANAMIAEKSRHSATANLAEFVILCPAPEIKAIRFSKTCHALVALITKQ